MTSYDSGQYKYIQFGYVDQGRNILCQCTDAGFLNKYHKTVLLDAITHQILWSTEDPPDGIWWLGPHGAVINSGKFIYLFDTINKTTKKLSFQLEYSEKIIAVSKDLVKIAVQSDFFFAPNYTYIINLGANIKEYLPYFDKSVFNDADFSPDNSKLVMHDWHHAYLIDLKAHAFKVLNEKSLWEPTPAFSPNGGLISILSGDLFHRKLCTLNPEGSEMKEIINMNGKGAIDSPIYSPDGRKFIFSLDEFNHTGSTFNSPNCGIYSINIDGSQMKKIFDGSPWLRCISPDGNKALSWSGTSDTYEILWEIDFSKNQRKLIDLK